MSALKYLLEKEFKQFKRNAFMPRMVLAFPLMVMFVLPWVATLDVRHINIGIVDNDHSAASARLIHRVAASDYFTLQRVTEDYPSVLEQVEKGNTDIVLEIPERFERNMEEGQPLPLQISANSVDNMKGTMGSNYLQQIITEDIAQENASRGREQTEPGVSVSVLNQYNPTLNYRHFMIPALMVVLVIIVCGFLPALNIVGEKEAGTIEQINVTPVSRMEFILAKLIPYWLIGLVVLTLCFIMAWAVYGLVPVGSFWMLYGISILFIWVMSGHRPHCIELFGNDAASHVCYVFLYHDIHADERIIYSSPVYAGLGKRNQRLRSAPLFYRSDAGCVSERKYFCSTLSKLSDDGWLSCPIQYLGHH